MHSLLFDVISVCVLQYLSLKKKMEAEMNDNKHVFLNQTL